MDMMDLLAKTGGLQSMAKELGLNEGQAASGAAALLPALLGGFKKQATSQATGPEGLGALLGKLGGGSLLDDVVSPQATNVSRGNDVLGQIFGSKEVSRTVAQSASTSSGLDPSMLRKMLPMLAMLVTGLMAKQHQGTGSAEAEPSAGGGLGGLLGGLMGGRSGSGRKAVGGLASMLDLDGDGNPLDDILKMAGK